KLYSLTLEIKTFRISGHLTMNEKVLKAKLVNDISIEVISKSIIKEANEIGFQRGDYIKLANLFLDSALNIQVTNNTSKETRYNLKAKVKLPLASENLKIREFIKKEDSTKLKQWMEDEIGRYFILTRATSRVYNVDRLIEDD